MVKVMGWGEGVERGELSFLTDILASTIYGIQPRVPGTTLLTKQVRPSQDPLGQELSGLQEESWDFPEWVFLVMLAY